MPKLFSCKCFNSKAPEILRMDYSHRGLREVPADIFVNERTLEEINLEYNNIDQLRKELFCCRELRKINLSDNEIRDIPVAIGNLNNLQELNISKNNIEEISDNISQCKQLIFLDISVNPMGKLPDGVTKLSNLTELLLNDCFLTFLTGTIGRLSNLKVLELRENQLKTLPNSIGRLSLLERLDVGGNELTELPTSFGDLSSLLEFWCDQNELTTLPQTIGNLKHLMFLDLTRNEICSLPSEIGSCLALSDLLLSSNHISELPTSIGQLSNLSTFCLESNQLLTLPDSIGNLNSLSEFSVSNNYLECLPPNIGLLRNLRVLYADNNRLSHIPPDLGSCSGITVLSLRSNLLTELPEELSRIPKLRVLNLSNNQLRSLPFNFIRFKQLQALWLSDNQSQPLVQLQQDRDIETGERCLVCYLLPQMTKNRGDVTPRGSNGCREESPSPGDDRQRIIRFDCESDHENARQPIPKDFPDPSRARLAALRNHRLSACSPTNSASQEKIYSSIQPIDEQNHNLIKPPFDPNSHHQLYQRYFQINEQHEVTPNHQHVKTSQISSSQQEIIYSTTYDKLENLCQTQHNISMQNYIQRSLSHNGSFQVPPPPGYINNHRLLNHNAEITAVPSQVVFNSQGSFRSSGSSISNMSASVVQGRRVLSTSNSANQRLDGSLESLSQNHSQMPGQEKETPTQTKVMQRKDQTVDQLFNNRSRSHHFPTGYESDTAAFTPRSSNRANVHPTNRSQLMASALLTNGDKSSSNRTLTNYSVTCDQDSSHADMLVDIHRPDIQHFYAHQMVQRANGTTSDGYCTDTAAVVCRKPPQAVRRRSPHQTVINQRSPADRKALEMAMNSSNNTKTPYIRQSNSVQTSVSSMSSSGSLKGSNSLPGFTANWISEASSHLTSNGAPPYPSCSCGPSAAPIIPNPLDGLAGVDAHCQRPLPPPPPAVRAEPERTSLSSDSGYSPSGGLGRNNLPHNGQLNIAIPGLNSSLPAPPPPVRSPPPLPDEDSGGPSPAPGSSLQGGLGSSCGEEERLTINDQSVLLPPQGIKKEVELTVVIQKNPGLGFSIVGGLSSGGNPYKPNDAGIFVTKVNNPGPAYGILLPGDKILSTDGIDLSQVDHKKAVTLLKSGGKEVTLLIQRSIDSCTSDI